MFRSIFIPIIVSVLTLFNFFSSDVNILLNMPTSANAGDEFLVEVTISKGDIEGFARFQQDLPVGFTAIARQTANGDFRFEDQKVKIQWMRVPYDREVVISYAIQVAPTVSGTFNFDGKFSYIFENGVQTENVPSQSITIIGDETAAGTAELASTTYSYQNVGLKNIDCIRQKPYLNENNEVIVNLMINKGDLKDFGKLQEQIPRGYRAESLRSKNSIFTFKNSIIKFLWMNMPNEPQFVVSYKLIPEGDIPDQAFIITGTFSYAENERTKTLNIADREVDLDNFQGDQLVAQTTTPETSEPVEVAQEETTTADYGNQTEYVADEVPIVTQPETPEENNNNVKTNSPDTYEGNLAAITTIQAPNNGVGYRVQIAAGHNLVSEEYFKKLNVTDEVQIEIHEGWHKYTVGNFPMYRGARDYRVYIWNNTPIHDAFVAAYNNGLRITVQEALMIANQKWYK
jgi:hypothetical protein